MGRMSRRKWLALGGAGVLGLVGLRFLVPGWMRSRAPLEPDDATRAFAERCQAGLDRTLLWDTHVHLIGLGAGGTGCRVDPEMLELLHPIKQFQFDVYKAGAGISNPETADADYVERLLALHRAMNPSGKRVVLAFDHHVDESGNERPERSPLFTPNEYALRLAGKHAELVPGASVHPYRPDAVERLDRAVSGGAVAVKWLPNAMGIDPGSSRCDAFYRRLAELRVPLITHAGQEYAVDSAEHQDFGNPLRLRRALDHGVRVVVAHCASLGSFADPDSTSGETVPSFDLFWRLFTDPAHEENLFADISTLTHVHHDPRPLRELLRAPELHDRLFYGSDYPLAALRFFVVPLKLQLDGLLSREDRTAAEKLFDVNPLLFDFAVFRAVRTVQDGRTYRFGKPVFETARLFDGIQGPA